MYHHELTPSFDGAFVHITHKYNPGGGSFDGLLIQPGGLTKINLNARHFKLINVDTGKVKQVCVEHLNSAPYKIINHDIYSIPTCKLDCAQWESWKNCSCVIPLDSQFLKTEFQNFTCSFELLKNCFYETVIKYKMEEITNCAQYCVTPCNFWEYTKTLSFIEFSKKKGIYNSLVNRSFTYTYYTI